MQKTICACTESPGLNLQTIEKYIHLSTQPIKNTSINISKYTISLPTHLVDSYIDSFNEIEAMRFLLTFVASVHAVMLFVCGHS